MHPIFLVFTSFIAVFGLIILFKSLANFAGLVDVPNDRKIHQSPTPKIGGLAIALFLIPYLYFEAVTLGISPSVLLGLLILILLSYLDDIKELPALIQFLCQLLIAFFIVHFGNLSVTHLGSIIPGHPDIILSSFCRDIFSVLALVGLINAFNMLDGLNGLLGCIALMLGVIFLCLGVYHQIQISVVLSLLLIGSLIAFLYFNFPRVKAYPHTIFLGDIGSSLLGFLFYWMTIEFTRLPQSPLPPIMLVWCLALPLLDMLRVIIQRLRLKKNITIPDQIHFHHLLMKKGWSTRSIISLAILITLISSSIGALSLIQTVFQSYLFLGFWIIFFFYRYWIENLK